MKSLEKTLANFINNDYSLIGDKKGCSIKEDLLNYAYELYDVLGEALSFKAIAGLAYVTWKRFHPNESPLEKTDDESENL